MAKMFIGVDPHKLSATIEVVDGHDTVLATGRFGTDQAGYAAMRKTVSQWPDRVWAVEGWPQRRTLSAAVRGVARWIGVNIEHRSAA